MKKYKVLIYLATYNGEAFLQEQLNSLFSQENIELDIIAFDDCSNDSTYDILLSNRKTHSNLLVFRNEKNMGYKKNFLNMIRYPLKNNYDFFALSDQDDVWKKDKIISAINYLNNHEKKEAFLYSSNADLVDTNLKHIGYLNKYQKKTSIYSRLLENIATGCTMVFNEKLRELINKYPLNQILLPHDDIICKIALSCGSYFYDNKSFILYRQHGNNLIGKSTFLSKIKKYKKVMLNKEKSYHSEEMRIIYNTYFSLFNSEEVKKFFSIVSNYKIKVSSYFILLLNSKYRKKNLLSNVIFKTAVLLKKY